MVIGKKRLLASLIALFAAGALALPGSPLKSSAAWAQPDDAKAKALAVRLIEAGDQLMKQGDRQRKKNREEKVKKETS